MSAPHPSATDWRERLMAARAARLAQTPAAIDETPRRRVLICEAGARLLALPIESIERVMPFGRAAPLADSSPALIGVVARAGAFTLVYDLAILIGEAGQASGGHLLLLRDARPALGLRTARTIAVADLPLLIGEEAANLPQRQGLIGYGRHDGQIISILDIAALLPARADTLSGGS